MEWTTSLRNLLQGPLRTLPKTSKISRALFLRPPKASLPVAGLPQNLRPNTIGSVLRRKLGADALLFFEKLKASSQTQTQTLHPSGLDRPNWLTDKPKNYASFQ